MTIKARVGFFNRFPLYFVFILLMVSCAKEKNKDPLARALASNDVRIKKVMHNLERYEVQIRYTKIDRKNDSVQFTDYDFQVANDNYFYPASTVKFPAAVATLEKLNELDSMDLSSRFYVEGDTVDATFAKAIQQIFILSDNNANNRLIEFLGFDDLNGRIQKRGISPIQICHRLATDNADDVTSRPLVLYLNDSTTSISKPIVSKNPPPLKLERIKKGKGFYEGDSVYLEPFNFSFKNYFPIIAQHNLLKRILFPLNFPKKERFNFSRDQHEFLLNAMGALPKDAGYDKAEYYDSYVKFFMFGDSKEPIPEHIEIYNKVGYAYGTLTDCAYIKDIKNNIDFMLTATILVNENDIFNDDNYEYDEIGIPFLAQLGRELYSLELSRTR